MSELSDAIASARAEASSLASQVRIVSQAAPSLTTCLLVITVAIGFVLGWWVSGPFHRRTNNAEWRANIAAQNAAVRGIIAQGNAEGEEVDNEVIRTIGDSYAKLKEAEKQLRKIREQPVTDRCSVPADCLRE